MTACRFDESVLQMYVEGGLAPAEQALVDAHLSGCPGCRRRLSEYKALLWDLAHPRPAPPPPELQALSDRLMTAWDQAQAEAAAAAAARQAPRSWLGAAFGWTRTTPVVAPAVGAIGTARRGLGAAGRALPKAGLAGLRWLLGRGGGRR